MTFSRNTGHSRPSSSGAASVAPEILRRRDRPYKTEQATVRVRKKKLDLHTSYKKAPPGYTFLPVGTPDLADLCKELSRQRGFPVNVVNAKPMSKHAIDPDKVSHHIHRIGYHFKAEIVDDAREQLGYVYYRGKFIKEDVMQAQQSKGRVNHIMAKYGIKLQENNARETPEQVNAFIKELFPRIPQDDLDKIVEHAWKEGSRRVGTNENMSLVNRVQLAVTARIRHAYTDYDRLLKAFEWRDARMEVEPECVKKLKEWRGEDANDDDEKGFEETIQDVIVIPDDDEDEKMGEDEASESEEDDASVGDADYASDPSVEIVEHRVADNDFTAESAMRPASSARTGSRSAFRQLVEPNAAAGTQQRYEHPQPFRAEQSRASIYMQSAPQSTYYAYQAPQQAPQYAHPPVSQPVVVSVPYQSYRAKESDIELGGHVFRREELRPKPSGLPHGRQELRYDNQPPQYRRVVYEQDPYWAGSHPPPQDRPLPSIERIDEHPQVTPTGSVNSHMRQVQQAFHNYSHKSAEIVDLTTPPPPQRAYYPPAHGAPHPAQYYGR